MEKHNKKLQETQTSQLPSLSKQESMSEEISTGYEPREPQKEIHKSIKDNRWTVAVAHRRMGKTVCAINQLIHSVLKCDKKNPQFASISLSYNQSKRSAFHSLTESTRPLEPKVNDA